MHLKYKYFHSIIEVYTARRAIFRGFLKAGGRISQKYTSSNNAVPAADWRKFMATKKANPLMDKIKEEFPRKLQLLYSVSPEEASDKQVYHVLSSMIVEILGAKRQSFINHTSSVGGKQIYYLSMEFLMGRSLKTSIYNLELADGIKEMLKPYGQAYR